MQRGGGQRGSGPGHPNRRREHPFGEENKMVFLKFILRLN